MQQECLLIQITMISARSNLYCYDNVNSRYPFVATDILISSMRIAEAFIKIKEVQEEVEEEIQQNQQEEE
jgi:hypothetical protein